MAKDNRESLIRKLLKELPELLADYEHLEPDSDGKIDPHRDSAHRRSAAENRNAVEGLSVQCQSCWEYVVMKGVDLAGLKSKRGVDRTSIRPMMKEHQ